MDKVDVVVFDYLAIMGAALAREVAIPWWESGMLAELAQLALNAGRVAEGETRARESLTLAEQMRDATL